MSYILFNKMNKQKRLILIDGSAYIFRAYYALPPMSRKDGTPVNAVFGFTNMLVKLIEDYSNEKLVVIFDAARENFRNKIYPKYKANRGETPEDLIPQFEIIKNCVKAFQIPQIELEGYEADDIIATYTNLAQKKNISSLIISSDKDLMQLVTDKVQMLDPMKNKSIGIDEVIEKFGVKPDKVIQIQALTGDKIDNIPGAPGIGPKTALELIKEFGDIEGLIKNANLIKQAKRKKIIQDSESNIRVSLELVKLEKNVKLPLLIDEIIPYSKIKNSSVNIKEFLVNQGFRVIMQRLENNSFINKDISNSKIDYKSSKVKYSSITNVEDFQKIYMEIKKMGICAIDTETDSLDIEKANLVGISLCYDEDFAYYIPITIRLDKCPKNTLVCLTGYSFQGNDILGTFFKKYFPKFTKPIILILIESDYYILYKSWIEHPMITHIYGWNIPVNHEKVSAIPIGLNYYRQGIIMQQILPRYTPPEQTYLLGINFSANTNPIRSKLVTYSKTKWKDFCTQIKHFPNIQNYIRKTYTDGATRVTVTNPQYYNEISKFKFVLSPPGAGVDCHRTWELLYLGCIPIVEHSTISELYEDLPILVVDNWDDISNEFLEMKYKEIKKNLASRRYKMEKLYADYWFRLISNKV